MIRMPAEKTKIKDIIAWALYDFASSSYFVVILTFVFATYFSEKIAPNTIDGTTLWGYTISASAFFIAIISPFLGAIADYGGHSKRWLFFFTYLGIITTGLLWFAYPSPNSITLTLVCIFISNFALEESTVFYNAFLPKIAPKAYLGRISGWGWGCGYLGGIFCLLAALYFFIAGHLDSNTANAANIRAIALLVVVWLIIFSLPLFLIVQSQNTNYLPIKSAVKKGLKALLITLKTLPQQKNLSLFLIARIIYMDGLNTLFALGGIYAAGTFGLSVTDIVIFGITMNISAGIGAALFAWLDDWLGSKNTVLLALLGLLITFCFLLTVKSSTLFWFSAPTLGLFVGPVQAASRTFLARLAKPNEITRMYGLYSFTGKVTSFLGPLLVGIFTTYFDSQRLGMAVLLPFFIIGGAILLWVKEPG
ncbi:MFS transporter [Legionella maceachernii]|uniref:MFS transporter family transporter protein n=1 Tax=Legionella maceachernii TaxID=466 RepID=A0A0W0VW68_9GAMM|nr:MFS transporter [Legionella maceachernii]KTD24427.1 MFS transporter family transporter protein [Legionella maceachernii]SJZ67145.1 MFS transporter, UMF1 family [Legionella maceachernii]SUP02016.1 Vacuole effluxer Atg22 like [Legionella maceachernii]